MNNKTIDTFSEEYYQGWEDGVTDEANDIITDGFGQDVKDIDDKYIYTDEEEVEEIEPLTENED